MSRKCYTSEQIIVHLPDAEVELAKGQATGEVCRKLGITEQTYYRRRKEYGSWRLDQARRMKDLERENGRLKKLVADQALDLAILKEASSLTGAGQVHIVKTPDHTQDNLAWCVHFGLSRRGGPPGPSPS